MKLYYVYSKSIHMHDWFSCVAIFENGWAAFSHICSSPSFAPGDLWRTRKERQEIIKKMKIEVEDTGEIIDDATIDTTHPELLKANLSCDQKYWNDLYESFGGKEYLNVPSVKVEFTK